ncbi:uncharacterized protein LOC142328833 isoform X2 [Lycorma delicatula]|uniref:uncharacterized protein LOC142328833 isoform X2 n=1 Tax=Lycorma delicatula TaxID=130591 RepID=UPI003F516A67
MLESSHASWLGASTSSLADSYQYQLQSMWQKCWNTNQSLVHNLRFRERGPLKSWRPETMAEAILSVLKEGLSLSQAARKYDIPYPTFVLYANRVHNMLGPSADGGTDLRPKGRGRPQRILLGIWPEDHIHGVIRAVVFRDPQHMKEEALNLGYHRIPEPMYGSPGGCTESSGGVSPGSAAAAAVVAVAQGLRQQMLAAAHHNAADHHFNFLAAHCGNGTGLGIHSPLPSPVDSSPRSSPLSAATSSANNNLEFCNFQSLGYKPLNDNLGLGRPEHLFQDEIEDLVTRPKPSETPKINKSHPLLSQQGPGHLHSSGIPPLSAYKPPTSLSHPMIRPEQLFQDEIEDLVKRPQSSETPKAPQPPPTPPQSQGPGLIHTGGVPPIYKHPNSNSQSHGPLSVVRADHLFQDEIEDLVKRPSSQPMDTTQKVKVGIGMTYKPTNENYSTPRPDSLFQDDIDELVKSPQATSNQKEQALPLQVDQRID